MQDAGRAVWLAERREGLGGTDAAGILGASKWSSPYVVWSEKKGLLPPKATSEPMWWGTELEDIVAKRYVERTGRKVWNPERKVFRHPEHEFLLGTPDRLIIGERRGLEIKTANAFASDEWGPDGSDQVPEAYLVQCVHYMAITGFPVWDLAVLIGGSDFRVYTIRRDLDLEGVVVSRLVEWWNRYIVGGEEPPTDGSASTADALSARYPAVKVGAFVVADHLGETWAARLVQAKAEIAHGETIKREAENALKAEIAENDGIEGRGWRATWRETAARKVVDWQEAVRRLAARLDALQESEFVTSTLADVTRNEPGVRRFVYRETAGANKGGNG